MERVKKQAAKAKTPEKGVLDLCIRLRDDGGPLFSAMAAIGDSHLRADRVRQLLYLGLLKELEITAPVRHNTPPAVNEPIAPRNQEVRPVEVAAEGQSEDGVGTTTFHAEDLAAVFG